MSIIYLTDTRYGQQAWDHPSARHRCYHFADALRARGIRSSVMPLERVSVDVLREYEHVVFHRPSHSRRFSHAFACCQKTPVRVHADYDDLIFQTDIADQSPLYVDSNRSLEIVTAQFQRNLDAAKQFDSFILSTEFLRQEVLSNFPGVHTVVLANSLPRLFVMPETTVSDDVPLTIGYFPGSKGHGRDFSMIRSVLKEIVGGGVRLVIVGRLDRGYTEGISSVTHVPFTSYGKYLQLLSHVDVSIAPLTDSLFNQSKSAVKLIESVSVATPIVASTNQDMRDHNNPLAELVDNEDDWYRCLVQNLSDAREKRECHIDLARGLSEIYSANNRVGGLLERLQWAA